jgi:raffinose synthase
VRMAKDDFGIQTFLVWHTLNGYWGGVDGARLSGYGVIDQVRRFGEGILAHEPTFNEDWWGSLVGFVPAAQIARFYDDYHRSLAAQGVDGVKVDSQATLEGLCEHQGSRVRVSRAYRQALEGSVRRHFDGRLINCMSNAQETWYGSPDSTLLRTSVDFYPTRPELHGLHLYTNAQVGVWFGEFMHPDWDMFQSGHEWGAFHAAGRAVSGGPVYASDKPGAHSFELLKKLVCSDGSALLCDAPGLPTQDCLCHDPTRENILLKLWNRNRDAALVGVFHCQYSPDSNQQRTLEGTVSPSDVPGFAGSKFASYAHQARTLDVLDKGARQPISLNQGGYELFSFVPVEHGFAAIGLADKMNSAGALSRVGWQGDSHVELELRDGGEFLAYSERPPVKVEVDGQGAAFEHDAETGTLSLKLVKNGKQTLSVRF